MISSTLADAVETKFRVLYGEQPCLVRSPGRVNLIGEHTDYNMGYVLPAAIDKAVYFAIAPRSDQHCCVFALDLNRQHQFAVSNLHHASDSWPDYLIGVVDQLVKGRHEVRGFNCVFGGDIPVGAGLSSSAAIEGGLAYALNRVFNLGIDPLPLVKLAQRAENEFVGVRCGIMDQYINIFGQAANALRIDCRSLEHAYYPFDHAAAIVLFNTGVTHSLASSEYNLRRTECANGVDVIRKDHPEVTSLRDVLPGMIDEYAGRMEPKTLQRCTYVVHEDDRVLRACTALDQRNLNEFGALMFESHDGLSGKYQVSCAELDYLVDLVHNDTRVFGARMMGGGFGGCTINLVKPEGVEELGTFVMEEYRKKFGKEPAMYVTTIGPGTSVISSGA
jgi:galactokinase